MSNYPTYALILVAMSGWLMWFPPRFILRLFSRAVFYKKTTQKVVAITIDDVTSPYTSKIVEVFNEHHIPGTFFVIGSHIAPWDCRLLGRMVAQGHELANHDFYDRASVLVDPIKLYQDLNRTHDLIWRFQNFVKWFRPGGGWYSATTKGVASQFGYQIALGDVYGYDPHFSYIPEAWAVKFLAWHILWRVQPGSIIILHDGTKKRAKITQKVLDIVIPALREKHYEFRTLSNLF